MPLFSHYGEDIPDISSKLSYPSLVFAIVTPLVVLARFLSRMVSGRVGADDWVILVSCVFAETVSVQMIVVCEWAFGKHVTDVPKALTTKTLKLYFIAQILYKLNIGLTKISILLLYIRLFIRPWFLRTCWICLLIIVAFTTGTVMSSILQCIPVRYAFDKSSIPKNEVPKCINMTAFWYANAVFNIASDLVIIVLPVPVILGLQLPRRTRGGLCAIFAVGVFVCITSILRITTLNIATSHLDITWNSIGSSMWTVIESNLGIICACLPALRRPLAFAFVSASAKSVSRLYPKYVRGYSGSWGYIGGSSKSGNNGNGKSEGEGNGDGEEGDRVRLKGVGDCSGNLKEGEAEVEAQSLDLDLGEFENGNGNRSRNRSISLSGFPRSRIQIQSNNNTTTTTNDNDHNSNEEQEQQQQQHTPPPPNPNRSTSTDSQYSDTFLGVPPEGEIRKTTKVVVSYDRNHNHDHNNYHYGYGYGYGPVDSGGAGGSTTTTPTTPTPTAAGFELSHLRGGNSGVYTVSARSSNSK